MRGIEFSRNVTLGQFVSGESRVHRLSPATKYVWLLALVAAGIAGGSVASQALLLGIALACGAAAGMRPSFLLRSAKPLLPLLAFVACLQFAFGAPGDGSAVLLRLGPASLTAYEARLIAMMAARTLSLVSVIGLFTSVTSESQSMHGLEDILAPFAALGIPARRVSLAAGIVFRFIPIVALELESIVKAQASRGADFGSGRGGPIAKARAYLPLFVPVTVRALERAESLAVAMEARCYSETGVTRYAQYPRTKGEAVARIAAIAACAAVIAIGRTVRIFGL